MKNHILRYGLIGGCVNIALGLTNWFTVARLGPTISQAVGWLSIIAAFMCVPLGIIYFRDKLNDGDATFGQAFKTGIGITFVFSLLSGIYSVLFFLFAGEGFEKWRRQGMNDAELQALEAQLEQTPAVLLSPVGQGFMFFVIVLIIGIVVTLISSLVLKRSN